MSTPTVSADVQPTSSILHDRKLRLWPGALLVAVLWSARWLANLGEPSPLKFFISLMVVPLGVLLLTILWWLFFSRLQWKERGLIVGVLAAVAVGTWAVSRQTFPAMAMIMYAVPILVSAWVGWLVLSYALSWPIRRAGLLLLFVVMGAVLSSIRVEGMDGSFAAKISPRWQATSEEKLLAELNKSPHVAPPVDEAVAEQVVTLKLQPGDWPGFRGATRDSRLSGVQIATDWEPSPPQEIWRHRVGPGWSSFAVVDGHLFTQEQRGDDELVVCYDAATGTERWAHRDTTRFNEVVAGPGPRGTPTFDNGFLYALGASGNLNCLDAATGALRWTRDILKDSDGKVPQWGYSSSPLVVDGIVSVFAGGPAGKSVLGYKTDNGELAWSAGEGQLSYCSTQLAKLGGSEQLLIATDAGLTAFRPQTGEVLWRHEWQSDGVARIVQPTVLDNGDVLIGTGMGVGTRRISIGAPDEKWPIKELWTSKAFRPYFNDLVLFGDHLYGFDNNLLVCVSLDDGTLKWRTRGYGSGQVLLLVDQSLLLVLTETGDVALVKALPEKNVEIARFTAIDGKTWNHPVVAHGKLYVRNGDEMACFQLRPLSDSDSPHAAVPVLAR